MRSTPITINMMRNKRGQRSRSLGTKMSQSLSAHIFVKSGSIYVKPRPKWLYLYTYQRMHFTSASASFLWYLSVCLLRISRSLPFVHSILARRMRKFMFCGNRTTYTISRSPEYIGPVLYRSLQLLVFFIEFVDQNKLLSRLHYFRNRLPSTDNTRGSGAVKN